jgi:hypothetical protein
MGAPSGPVDGFLLGRDDAELAAALARYAVAQLRRNNGAAPPNAVALADDLERFARTSSPQASATGEHANLPDDDDLASSGARIGATAAAALTGLTPQHVRRLCRGGGLSAARGPRGAWEIDQWSVAGYARQRKDAACLLVSDFPNGSKCSPARSA